MLRSILYYPLYGFLYVLSLLPLRLLYLLSDAACFVFFKIFGYRKVVVMENLQAAFPEKSMEELKRIADKFYINFTDNFIETLKLLSADQKFITSHFVIENPEVYEQFFKVDKRCQVHLGHVFNWEMASVAVPFYTEYPFLIVYMPLKNALFNRLLRKLRTRTGTVLLPATDMRKAILPYREMRYMIALVADQAPGNPANAYWLNFFGRPTPMIRGPERGARVGNIPTVFAEISKVKRGYYRARIELGVENPAELPEGELTRRYVDFLQKSIARNPSMWLWSHRRWKHGWKEEYKTLWIGGEGIV
jgi:Kdo2-lipid IVA lauroyltransferase/acyltransferase